MPLTEIQSKTILRKQKKIDSWFVMQHSMNLYKGCMYACAYCDGRDEGYYVQGEFSRDIAVKTNAIDILRRELDPARKRKPFRRSFMLLGGGITDAYQAIEKKYELSRQALELMLEFNHPVHVITKSPLVEKDLDLLQKINAQSRAIVSFSFSSVDDSLSEVFEPGVAPPSERLQSMRRIKAAGIPCGMFLMPVIPFVTDSPQMIDDALKQAQAARLDYVVAGGMTLKEGSQMDTFYKTLEAYDESLLTEYDMIYSGDKWGNATSQYTQSLNTTLYAMARRYHIPLRIPQKIWHNLLDDNDRVVVMLEHIDYYLRLRGSTSPFRATAYNISKIKEPLANIRGNLNLIKGAGNTTLRIIREILDTGRCSYLNKLANL